MFERVVSYFLQKYLGWLVKGLDAEALNVSIWGGDIVLNNLELQENALDFLHLPVQVKNGCLQQLKLQIPWTSLGSSQTVIEISGLYAVVYPSDQFEYNEEEEKQMLIAAKKAKLAELNASTDKKASDNDDSAGNGGFVAGMITKIVNNLKLVISDVHFRLEDKSSDERHPFAVGAVLKEIRLDSVDEIWKSVDSGNDLTSAKLQGLIRKSLTIDQLGLYLDSNLSHSSLFVRAGHNYEQPQTIVQDMKWKGGRLESCSRRQYLIKPVNVAVKVAVDDSMIGGQVVQDMPMYIKTPNCPRCSISISISLLLKLI